MPKKLFQIILLLNIGILLGEHNKFNEFQNKIALFSPGKSIKIFNSTYIHKVDWSNLPYPKGWIIPILQTQVLAYIYINTAKSGLDIFTSSDLGCTWASQSLLVGSIADYADNGEVSCSESGQYCSLSNFSPNNSIYFSSDFMWSWHKFINVPSCTSYHIGYSYSGEHVVLYCRINSSNIIISTSGDNGDSWIYRSLLPITVNLRRSNNDIIIVVSDDGGHVGILVPSGANCSYLLISHDHGVSWNSLSASGDEASPIIRVNQYIDSIYPDLCSCKMFFAANEQNYIILSGHKVLISSDYGQYWDIDFSLPTTINVNDVTRIAITQDNTLLLFISSNDCTDVYTVVQPAYRAYHILQDSRIDSSNSPDQPCSVWYSSNIGITWEKFSVSNIFNGTTASSSSRCEHGAVVVDQSLLREAKEEAREVHIMIISFSVFLLFCVVINVGELLLRKTKSTLQTTNYIPVDEELREGVELPCTPEARMSLGDGRVVAGTESAIDCDGYMQCDSNKLNGLRRDSNTCIASCSSGGGGIISDDGMKEIGNYEPEVATFGDSVEDARRYWGRERRGAVHHIDEDDEAGDY